MIAYTTKENETKLEIHPDFSTTIKLNNEVIATFSFCSLFQLMEEALNLWKLGHRPEEDSGGVARRMKVLEKGIKSL